MRGAASPRPSGVLPPMLGARRKECDEGAVAEAAAVVQACGAGPARRSLIAACWAFTRRESVSTDLLCLLVRLRYPARRPFDFLRMAAQHRLSRLERAVSDGAAECYGRCYACMLSYLDGHVARAEGLAVGDCVRLRRSADRSNGDAMHQGYGGRGLLDEGGVGTIDATTDVNVRIRDGGEGSWYARGAVYKIVDHDQFEHSTLGAVRLYPQPITIPIDDGLFRSGPPISWAAAKLKQALNARLSAEGFTGEVHVSAEPGNVRCFLQIVVL